LSKNIANTNGGAFYINEYSNAIIKNSVFTENSAITNGGAFFVLGNINSRNNFVLENNLFKTNTANSNGGVAYLSGFTVYKIDRNKFYENISNGAGGVFFIFNAAIPSPNEDIYITNNIFYGNQSKGATLGGGAIFSSNNT